MHGGKGLGGERTFPKGSVLDKALQYLSICMLYYFRLS